MTPIARRRFLATLRVHFPPMSTEQVLYTPGQRVRITQQVQRQRDTFTTTIEGTVVKFEQQKTGSWYAHAQDNKLWLDRLELRKDDGETVVLNLDRNSRVEAIS